MTRREGEAGRFPHRRFPCDECPWRRNAEPGRFPDSRYAELRATSTSPNLGDPMFGCHKGEPGTNEDLACAGWLAVAGRNHPSVRLAVAHVQLDVSALDPGQGWPPLFGSYDEMAASQRPPGEDNPDE